MIPRILIYDGILHRKKQTERTHKPKCKRVTSGSSRDLISRDRFFGCRDVANSSAASRSPRMLQVDGPGEQQTVGWFHFVFKKHGINRSLFHFFSSLTFG